MRAWGGRPCGQCVRVVYVCVQCMCACSVCVRVLYFCVVVWVSPALLEKAKLDAVCKKSAVKKLIMCIFKCTCTYLCVCASVCGDVQGIFV